MRGVWLKSRRWKLGLIQESLLSCIIEEAGVLFGSGERFTVQWDRVHVTNHVDDGEFTFQTSLFRNGTIHFVYREVDV